MDTDRKDIDAAIGTPGYPTKSDIEGVKTHIAAVVHAERATRLAEKKAAFESHIRSQIDRPADAILQTRSVTDMLSDIVAAMKSHDAVPEGLLVAFRKQGEGGDDSDIRKIWRDMVDLGLVDPSATGKDS